MTPRQELDQLADKMTPVIRDAFLAAIGEIRDDVILKDLVKAITAGDYDEAFRTLGFSEAAMRPMIAAITAEFEQAGNLTFAMFPKHALSAATGVRVRLRFNVRDPAAERWIAEHSSRLITSITEDARIITRDKILVGMQEGRNPLNVALDLVGRYDMTEKRRVGGAIGLTPGQEGWVANVRRDLIALDERYFTRDLRDHRFDSIVRQAIDSDKPLKAADVDRIVDRYRDRALKYRGNTIGRVEALQALNAGEYQSARQLVSEGIVTPDAIAKIWDDTGDRKTRRTHVILNNQRKTLDEPFISASGAQMMFPGDTSLHAPGDETINCRCRMKIDVDWLHDVK
jgi:hypothetical protein